MSGNTVYTWVAVSEQDHPGFAMSVMVYVPGAG